MNKRGSAADSPRSPRAARSTANDPEELAPNIMRGKDIDVMGHFKGWQLSELGPRIGDGKTAMVPTPPVSFAVNSFDVYD